MQQTFKTKVTDLSLKRLEAKDASDESSDMNETEHSDELFETYTK